MGEVGEIGVLHAIQSIDTIDQYFYRLILYLVSIDTLGIGRYFKIPRWYQQRNNRYCRYRGGIEQVLVCTIDTLDKCWCHKGWMIYTDIEKICHKCFDC